MTDAKSIFELYGEEVEDLQTKLNYAVFPYPPVLHLPEIEVIDRLRSEIMEKVERGQLRNADILFAYQQLSLSAASSDIVCGHIVNGNRCGGLMDIEVNVFGAYYQCRVDSSHRFPV